jgi:hypothetical protein
MVKVAGFVTNAGPLQGLLASQDNVKATLVAAAEFFVSVH